MVIGVIQSSLIDYCTLILILIITVVKKNYVFNFLVDEGT